MTTRARVALLTVIGLLWLASIYCLYAYYAARTIAEGVNGVVQAFGNEFLKLTKPLVDADFFARYDAATATFTIRQKAVPNESSHVSENGLAERIMANGPASVVIIVHAADFPDSAQLEAFQSRIRSSLEA